jgi:hypothetical protein
MDQETSHLINTFFRSKLYIFLQVQSSCFSAFSLLSDTVSKSCCPFIQTDLQMVLVHAIQGCLVTCVACRTRGQCLCSVTVPETSSCYMPLAGHRVNVSLSQLILYHCSQVPREFRSGTVHTLFFRCNSILCVRVCVCVCEGTAVSVQYCESVCEGTAVSAHRKYSCTHS